MANKTPVNMNLFTIRMPITAYVSIAHRLSGLLTLLFIPVLLCALQASLASAEQFEGLKQCFSAFWMRALLWLMLSALFYHIIAGLRHLLMDMHIGEGKASAKRGAWIVIAAGLGMTLFFACYLELGGVSCA